MKGFRLRRFLAAILCACFIVAQSLPSASAMSAGATVGVTGSLIAGGATGEAAAAAAAALAPSVLLPALAIGGLYVWSRTDSAAQAKRVVADYWDRFCESAGRTKTELNKKVVDGLAYTKDGVIKVGASAAAVTSQFMEWVRSLGVVDASNISIDASTSLWGNPVYSIPAHTSVAIDRYTLKNYTDTDLLWCVFRFKALNSSNQICLIAFSNQTFTAQGKNTDTNPVSYNYITFRGNTYAYEDRACTLTDAGGRLPYLTNGYYVVGTWLNESYLKSLWDISNVVTLDSNVKVIEQVYDYVFSRGLDVVSPTSDTLFEGEKTLPVISPEKDLWIDAGQVVSSAGSAVSSTGATMDVKDLLDALNDVLINKGRAEVGADSIPLSVPVSIPLVGTRDIAIDTPISIPATQTKVDDVPTDLVTDVSADDVVPAIPSDVVVPEVSTGDILADFAFDLTDIFPFCIIWDLSMLFDKLRAEPVAPAFEYPVSVPSLNWHFILHIDLSSFNSVAEVLRMMERIGFLISLCWLSFSFLKGGD